MKRRYVFFVILFIMSFFICGIDLIRESVGDMLKKGLEPGDKIIHNEENGYGEIETEITKGNMADESLEDDFQEPYMMVEVGYDYFDDALFIGDSRTVGLMEYGNIGNSTFFADSGMSVFSLENEKVFVAGEGEISFDEVLNKDRYGKIYLMLGINELGYCFEDIEHKYKDILEKIRFSQSDAIIYLCGNMHVTKEQSDRDEIYNNENVNRVNEMIAGLENNKNIFYIDVNELFDDEGGSLSEEYSSDSFHIYGKYYMDWVDWLRTKAINNADERLAVLDDCGEQGISN